MSVDVVVGYSNLGQRTKIKGRYWGSRKPIVIKVMKAKVQASVYLLAECDYLMALDLALGLGWTDSEGRPCWRTDENRNTVVWDPGKWRDLASAAVSLSATPGDLGDRDYRSVSWAQLEHRASGERVWFGASHLSNTGDNAFQVASDARTAQARILADTAPAGTVLLGIDRNSWEGSPPDLILSARLPLLTAGLKDTFVVDGRDDGSAIDGMYGTLVTMRSLAVIDPAGGTDHAILRAGVRIGQP